jgi:hypothetical protein
VRADGSLAEAASAVPRGIPGLPYAGIHTGAAFVDATASPPKVLGQYPVFVPRADADGIAIAGIRMLPLAVPRATYTGWNPRAEGYSPGVLFPLQGAVVPFAATREAREAAKDPRPSLAERYVDEAAYVDAVRRAGAEMVAQRLLLPEDAERAVEAAKEDRLSQLR